MTNRQTHRQIPRPVQKEQQVLLWCPRYQKWLSINNLAYKEQKRRLTADTRDEEIRSSGWGERAYKRL